MDKLKEPLVQEINDIIKANGIGEITGPIMNGVLNDMVTTLHGVHFEYPVHSSVLSTDIGKLMMVDTTGLAKVYNLSPERLEQKGKWRLTIHDLEPGDNPQIKIEQGDNSFAGSRNEWLMLSPYYPATIADELSLIHNFLYSKGFTQFSYNISSAGDSLTIEELTYQGSIFWWESQDKGFIEVLRESLPYSPPSPSNFPLGKLVGLTADRAMVSCAPVETYMLEGTVDVLKEIFSYDTLLQLNMDTGLQYSTNLILPANNGKVAPLDIDSLDFEGGFLKTFRSHFVGIAIASTSTTVTVMNFTQYSYILSVVLRLVRAGISITSKGK